MHCINEVWSAMDLLGFIAERWYLNKHVTVCVLTLDKIIYALLIYLSQIEEVEFINILLS